MNKKQFTKLMSIKGSSEYFRMTHNSAIEMTDLFLDTLADALVLDGKVKLSDYLIFEIKEPSRYKAGLVKNPKTGEMVKPRNLNRLTCKAGKKLREIIQGYDPTVPHDLSFLAAKVRSDNDIDLDDDSDDDNYDWFASPDF